MIRRELASMSTSRRILVRFLSLLALSLAASAGIIMFIVLPFEPMQHWHLLPDLGASNSYIYWLKSSSHGHTSEVLPQLQL